MDNLKYEQFMENLTTLIRSSGLDLGAAYYLTQTFTDRLKNEYYNELNREVAEQQKQQQEQKPEEVKQEYSKSGDSDSKDDKHTIEALYKKKEK